MVRRYHYAPQREICVGFFAICRVDLALRRGCWLESLSEVPERVPRLAFPRPLKGSSRRRCPVAVEESLAEDSALSGRGGTAA